MSYASISIFPSGDISIGVIPPRPRLATSPMGLSSLPNSHTPTPKPRRAKTTGITPYARRLVKSAVQTLLDECDRCNLAFITCTLPRIGKQQLSVIHGKWSEVVRQFNQMLSRGLQRANLLPEYVGVTEIQEKRLRASSELALHYHAVIPGRHPGEDWVYTPDDLRSMWHRAVLNASGIDIPIEFATRIEGLRKNPRNEMGKYLSKGNKVIKLAREKGFEHDLPRSWWSMNDSFRAKIKSNIIKLRHHSALFFMRCLSALERTNAVNLRQIVKEFTSDRDEKPQEVVIGYSGWFTSRRSYHDFLGSLAAYANSVDKENSMA